MLESQLANKREEIVDQATIKLSSVLATIVQSRFENLPDNDRAKLVVVYLESPNLSEFVDFALALLAGKRSSD